MAASAAKFKWKDGMVDDLLRSLSQFKSNIEYRNLDFNAGKPKQYEAVREAMARKYSSVDESWFGPETVTSIPEDIGDTQKEELIQRIKEEEAAIKKGYSRVMEKIKELRQKFSNAVTSGTRRLVLEFYDVMVQISGWFAVNRATAIWC